MRRRDVIESIAGLAVAWPLAVRAQQADQMRRVGVLLAGAESDPNQKADRAKFSNALQGSGWTEGRNITIIYRWAAGDPHRIEMFAKAANRSQAGFVSSAIHAGRRRARVPTVYPFRFMVTAGGLISYGVDNADLYRRAADYVDRILKGAKPADLPVQLPTRFELAVNLKTAKSLGLKIPSSLLTTADEVIE